jgi:lipopolysaccharide transport system permease protein
MSASQGSSIEVLDGTARWSEPAGDGSVPVTRIKPSKGWPRLGLREIYDYRELLYYLTWRDIKIRYKQTALGASWAILQPFLAMLIFSLFFGHLVHVPSDGVPYPIFAFAALVPFTFFQYGLTQASQAMVQSNVLITKIYCPRLIIPIAAVLSGAVDFVLAFVVLLGMMAYYGIGLTANVAFVPIFLALTLIAALAAGFWLSALNVRYRDVRYIVPFLTQLWLFATPVAYSSSLLHGAARTIFGLNPMTGIVEGMRWALLGTHTAPGAMTIVSIVVAVAFFIGGAYYFRQMERSFADVV